MRYTTQDVDNLSPASVLPNMETIVEDTNAAFFNDSYRKVNKFIEFTNQFPFLTVAPLPFACMLVNGSATKRLTVSLPEGTRAVRLVANSSIWYSFKSGVQLATSLTLDTPYEGNSQLQLSGQPSPMYYVEGSKQVDLYCSVTYNASIECYQ
jgi:hypothetical protein